MTPRLNLKNTQTDHADPGEDFIRMAEIASGNTVAFRDVLDLYTIPVFHFALSLLKDKQIAEDITQEACLALWKYAPDWQPTGKIKSWLFRVAHNLSIDEIRKRRPHVDIDDVVDTLTEERTVSGFQALHDNDVARLVREAIAELPVRQRAALMLVHYDDYSNSEGAEIMGTSVDAFESLLARGRTSLKNRLRKHKSNLWEG